MSWRINVRLWLVALAFLLTGVPSWAGPAEDAQAAWSRRADPGQTERAIALWEQALAQDPQQPDVLRSLAKACGRAFRKATKRSEKKKWAARALKYAELAVEQSPNHSMSYAYLGEAQGQWAQAHKGLKGLRTVKRAVEALEKAVALDPKNHYAHMVLAEFYRQAPAGLSVGDKRKALASARAAVEHGPAYPINHLVLARALLENDQKDEAIAQLRRARSLPPPPDAVPEAQSDQETAKRLLQELGASDTSGAPPAAPPAQTAPSVSGACGESVSETCAPAP